MQSTVVKSANLPSKGYLEPTEQAKEVIFLMPKGIWTHSCFHENYSNIHIPSIRADRITGVGSPFG